MKINPDDPSLEDIVSIKEGYFEKINSAEKTSRQKEVYEQLRKRGHDEKSAKKLSKLTKRKKTGLNQVIAEAIASQTIGGVNEDTIDTASDILGMNASNVKRWNIYTEWFNNYFSALQVSWLVEGISAGSDALFGISIPEDAKAGINQSYFWMRYAFTGFRQYMWTAKDKYLPSYLSIFTPSTAIFYVPSLVYEGWLILRRKVLNVKENALNKYSHVKEYLNGKLKNENNSKKDGNLTIGS